MFMLWHDNKGVVCLGRCIISRLLICEEPRPKVGASSKEKARLNWGYMSQTTASAKIGTG
jgi:hypothetical protein